MIPLTGFVTVCGLILCGPKPEYLKRILEEAHEMRKARRIPTH